MSVDIRDVTAVTCARWCCRLEVQKQKGLIPRMGEKSSWYGALKLREIKSHSTSPLTQFSSISVQNTAFWTYCSCKTQKGCRLRSRKSDRRPNCWQRRQRSQTNIPVQCSPTVGIPVQRREGEGDNCQRRQTSYRLLELIGWTTVYLHYDINQGDSISSVLKICFHFYDSFWCDTASKLVPSQTSK